MSSVCYPSKSVFPAQDVSDDTHPELSASTLAFSRFCLLSMRVSSDSEEGGKKRKEEGGKKREEDEKRKKQREQLLTATVPAAAPEDLGLADVTMLVSNTSSVPALEEFFCATRPLSVKPVFFLSSFLARFFLPAFIFPFFSFLHFCLPHFFPCFFQKLSILPFSSHSPETTLQASDSNTGTRAREPAHTRISTCTRIYIRTAYIQITHVISLSLSLSLSCLLYTSPSPRDFG